MAEDSIFTKIINKEIPANIRYEDDDLIVIDDINPMTPVHLLIITKQPYQYLEDVDINDDHLHARLLQVARKMAAETGIKDNYKIHLNVGPRVQAVHHVHLHVLGGWDKNEPREKLDVKTTDLINQNVA